MSRTNLTVSVDADNKEKAFEIIQNKWDKKISEIIDRVLAEIAKENHVREKC